MDVFSETTNNILNIRNAFHVISMLNLTSYLYPKQINFEQCPQVPDIIVVGAGSAGCVVAGRLAEAKMHVFLFEAGGDPPIETTYPALYPYILNSYLDWNYTDQECPGHCNKRDLILSRGKMIGGTGSMNGMIYVRGNPHDFNTWAEIANDSTWNYTNVLPFFKKSENLLDSEILSSKYGRFHGTDGPMKITRKVHKEMDPYLKAFEELGYRTLLNTNADENIGFSQPMYNIADNIRWSSGYAFISRMKNNPYLHVLKNTQVTKVFFDDCDNAIGVEAITHENKTITFKAKKEVVLSAGVFNSPQILMQSGIGPKENLEFLGIDIKSDLPVGQNLQDQLGVPIFYSMDRSKSPVLPQQPSTEYPGYILIGYGALNKSQSYPDFQMFPFRLSDDVQGSLQFCSEFFNLKDEICKQIYHVAKNRTIFFNVLVSFNLKSRGYVVLNSNDPKQLPYTSLGWFNAEEDVDTAVKYIEDFIKVSDTKYFKSVDAKLLVLDLPGCKDIPKGTSEYWKCYVRCMWVTEYHYGGTCALGSVVDSKLLVKGVQNLRVADSSVMPIVSSGNTNTPTVMIGEKAAQFIIDKYSKE